MQVTNYDSSQIASIDNAKVVILQAKWHGDLTDMLSQKCCATLREAGVNDIAVHAVPGSLEIPLAAKLIAKTKPDAIICFGIIIKGETHHFEMIANMCATGIMQVMLEHELPIINEILPVYKLADAAARAGNNQQNKGIEAALAAIEMIRLQRNL